MSDDCSKESTYKFQYGGRCLVLCPEKTEPNINNICVVKNNSICSKSEIKIALSEFLSSGAIDFNAKNYAKESEYVDKHIFYFYDSQYSFVIYKDLNCIEELNIKITKVDFKDCYSKIMEKIYPIKDKLIIGLFEN